MPLAADDAEVLELSGQLFDGLLNADAAGIKQDFRLLRRLIGRINTGELPDS